LNHQTNIFLNDAACDICDRFATTGFNANMITYLTKQIHMPMVQASNTITNFNGTSSLTPIIGGIMADAFAGRFWGITVGSILYLFGMVSLTVSAVVPLLHPPPCAMHQQCHQASSEQLFILYISLLLTAIGSGGIRSCVVPFGADQFELDGAQSTAKKGYISNIRYNYYN
jgi:solute carrier family 15 (peptide/histidine transporter), member 3/4